MSCPGMGEFNRAPISPAKTSKRSFCAARTSSWCAAHETTIPCGVFSTAPDAAGVVSTPENERASLITGAVPTNSMLRIFSPKQFSSLGHRVCEIRVSLIFQSHEILMTHSALIAAKSSAIHTYRLLSSCGRKTNSQQSLRRSTQDLRC